jgi:hypothetical protein
MSSEYVIRSFCYWAGDNETRGWSCANGDRLRDAVAWLAYRSAPTEFRWLGAKGGNPSLLKAKDLAKATLADSSPSVFLYTNPLTLDAEDVGPVVNVAKVFTKVPEVPETKERELPKVDVEDVIDPSIAHRGRRRCDDIDPMGLI